MERYPLTIIFCCFYAWIIVAKQANYLINYRGIEINKINYQDLGRVFVRFAALN